MAKVGIMLLIVVKVMGLIFCCCIPIVKSMIASRLDKQMIVTLRGAIETSQIEWEYVGDQSCSDDDEMEGEPTKV